MQLKYNYFNEDIQNRKRMNGVSIIDLLRVI